jgi:hypothetical protein
MTLGLLQRKDFDTLRVPSWLDCRQWIIGYSRVQQTCCSPGDVHGGPVCVREVGKLGDQKIRTANCNFIECVGGNYQIADSGNLFIASPEIKSKLEERDISEYDKAPNRYI